MAIGKAKGFTYLGLLLLIAIGGIGLAVVGQVWHTESQREREKELLFIGEQYAKAIGSYYENTPSGPKQYPVNLQDVLLDSRFPVVRRHLRKLYLDPMTGRAEWGLVKDLGRITGVYSLSMARPLKAQGFPDLWAGFAAAKSYRDWQFIYTEENQNQASIQQSSQRGENGQDINAGDNSPTNASASGQPEKPVLEGSESSLSTSSKDEPSNEQACLKRRGNDVTACSQYCDGTARAAHVCSPCMASVNSRYRACLSGDTLPELFSSN